jgi:hypothetical protein
MVGPTLTLEHAVVGPDGFLAIHLRSLGIRGPVAVALFDLMGRRVGHATVQISSDGDTQALLGAPSAAGVMFVEARAQGIRATRRVIVVH